ncbi:hypothetical protein BN11_4950003 [Nostocoides australiense Ben110]|uniref:Uncharacterized protein n=1 Tax=Nostocoides australiense Ben110 TaxID=1193182 RepID=W6JZ78_9MICO|nr:hypothetical protein BN11_4950003 [Tetrasphaera australiensis Ben110]
MGRPADTSNLPHEIEPTQCGVVGKWLTAEPVTRGWHERADVRLISRRAAASFEDYVGLRGSWVDSVRVRKVKRRSRAAQLNMHDLPIGPWCPQVGPRRTGFRQACNYRGAVYTCGFCLRSHHGLTLLHGFGRMVFRPFRGGSRHDSDPGAARLGEIPP